MMISGNLLSEVLNTQAIPDKLENSQLYYTITENKGRKVLDMFEYSYMCKAWAKKQKLLNQKSNTYIKSYQLNDYAIAEIWVVDKSNHSLLKTFEYNIKLSKYDFFNQELMCEVEAIIAACEWIITQI